MTLQTRMAAGMAILATIAIGTGSVLLLGYVLAAFSFAMMLALVTRRLAGRLLPSRKARRQTLSLARITRRRSEQSETRRAA